MLFRSTKSHSTFAYLGALLGHETISQSVQTPALRDFVDAMMRLEIAPTLKGIPDSGLEEYRRRFLARIANAALRHPTPQVAMDGSQKLPQRLLDTIRDRLRTGDDIQRLTLAVAAWLHYLRGVDEQGGRYVIQDPLAARLAKLVSRADVAARASAPSAAAHRRAMVLASFKPVFGELGKSPEFVEALATHLETLREHGVMHAVEAAT